MPANLCKGNCLVANETLLTANTIIYLLTYIRFLIYSSFLCLGRLLYCYSWKHIFVVGFVGTISRFVCVMGARPFLYIIISVVYCPSSPVIRPTECSPANLFRFARFPHPMAREIPKDTHTYTGICVCLCNLQI